MALHPPRQPPPVPPPRQLLDPFGLTPQQARVPASCPTEDEIGEALSISLHTARRHSEAVLAKLQWRRRKHVEDALLSQERSDSD